MGSPIKGQNISVIIPVAGNRPIKSLVSSIIKQANSQDEIVISASGMYPDLNGVDDSRIKIVFEEKVAGPSRNRNIGFINSNNSIIFFVDSDVAIEEACMDKIRYNDYQSSLYLPIINSTREPVFPLDDSPYGVGSFTAALSLNRENFLKIGPFNEDLNSVYREDSEFYYRAIKRGLILIPRIDIFHPMRRLKPKEYFRYLIKSSYEPLFHKLVNGDYENSIFLFKKRPNFVFPYPNKFGVSLLSFLPFMLIIIEVISFVFREILLLNVTLFILLLSFVLILKIGYKNERPSKLTYFSSLVIFGIFTCLGRIFGSIKYFHYTI